MLYDHQHRCHVRILTSVIRGGREGGNLHFRVAEKCIASTQRSLAQTDAPVEQGSFGQPPLPSMFWFFFSSFFFTTEKRATREYLACLATSTGQRYSMW